MDQPIKTYSFEKITSREQFMGREHFFEFRDDFVPEFSKHIVGGTFLALVRPRIKSRSEYYRPGKDFIASDLGLIVIRREDVPLPPIENRIPNNHLAIQAGSVTSFTRHFILNGKAYEMMYRFGEDKGDLLIALTRQLESQFTE